VAANQPCARWGSRRPRNSFGFTQRNCVAAPKPAIFPGRRLVEPGYFSRRTLPASFVPSMFSGGKRCK
jgi:hypothetical protein